ncbi:hypothetical protein [Burkholderia sp. MSMB1078WGS]|uniref:hypothetical protein n=1 Tax=Burkholderia sp. MSMB1078WGS TaxID=1637900 RepID=UPI00211D8C4F|nr:hypothetical protein [Burkholderia sp. MSMB1078WGS]
MGAERKGTEGGGGSTRSENNGSTISVRYAVCADRNCAGVGVLRPCANDNRIVAARDGATTDTNCAGRNPADTAIAHGCSAKRRGIRYPDIPAVNR